MVRIEIGCDLTVAAHSLTIISCPIGLKIRCREWIRQNARCITHYIEIRMVVWFVRDIRFAACGVTSSNPTKKIKFHACSVFMTLLSVIFFAASRKKLIKWNKYSFFTAVEMDEWMFFLHFHYLLNLHKIRVIATVIDWEIRLYRSKLAWFVLLWSERKRLLYPLYIWSSLPVMVRYIKKVRDSRWKFLFSMLAYKSVNQLGTSRQWNIACARNNIDSYRNEGVCVVCKKCSGSKIWFGWSKLKKEVNNSWNENNLCQLFLLCVDSL